MEGLNLARIVRTETEVRREINVLLAKREKNITNRNVLDHQQYPFLSLL
jgi:hypothetical protein